MGFWPFIPKRALITTPHYHPKYEVWTINFFCDFFNDLRCKLSTQGYSSSYFKVDRLHICISIKKALTNRLCKIHQNDMENSYNISSNPSNFRWIQMFYLCLMTFDDNMNWWMIFGPFENLPFLSSLGAGFIKLWWLQNNITIISFLTLWKVIAFWICSNSDVIIFRPGYLLKCKVVLATST